MNASSGESNARADKSLVRIETAQPLAAREVYFEVPRAAAENSSEWAHFADLGRALGRRKTLLVTTVLSGLLIALAVSVLSTPIYRASTSLEVQGINEDFLNLKNVDPAARLETSSAESYVQTQVDILQDDILLDRVINRLQLPTRSGFQPKANPLVSLAGAVPFIPAVKEAQQQRPIDVLRQNLEIAPSHHSRIVKIAYESQEPQLAAQVVNTLADEFINYNLEARLNAANQIGRWLGPELQEMKDKLERSESELSASSQSLLLNPSGQAESIGEEKLRNLQREFASAQADRIAKESLYRTIAGTSPDSIPAALDTPTLREDRLKLSDLRRQRAELGSLYTDDNYRVAKVQAQIEELEAAVKNETQSIPKRAKSDFDAAIGRELMLAKAYDAQAKVVSQQTRERIRFETLKSAVDNNRQIYESTLQRVKEAGIASAIKPSSVRIIGPAQAPVRPYRPNVPLNLSIGMAAGLCVGLVSAAALERNKRVLRLPTELKACVAAPVLGAIPTANNDSLYATRRKLLLDSRPEVHLELASWEEKHSPISESFQDLLASLIYSRRSQVLLVTSALPMEGKTTVASNLAIGLVQIGKRVLLIDGDLRKPRVHDIFGQPNTWGLSNLLTEKNSVAELPVNVLTKKTLIPGLSILPSGPATEQLTTMLYSPRMQDLMQHLRAEFDYIILDAPPALQFADARVLAQSADSVLLVARANQSSPETVQAAAERFHTLGVPVMGTILNDFDTRHAAHHGYGYGYGYRQ